MAKQVIGNDLLELFANNNKDASALPGAEASTPVVQSTPAPTQTYTEAPSKVATGIGQVISAPLKAMAAPVRAVSKGVDKLIDDNTNSKLLGAINKGAKSVTSALSNDALTNAGERALVGAADTIDSFAAAPAAKRAAFNAFEQNTIGNGVRTAQNIQLSKEYRQRALEADTKAREIREKDISGNLLGEGYKAFRAQTEEDRSKLSTAGQFISDLGYSTGQMAPGIAASALTGGALGAAGVGEATVKTLSSAAGLATMYKNVYSNTYSENRNNGYDISESSKNANAKALIEVATEIAGGGLALTDMGGLTEAGLNKAGTALSRVGEKLIGSDAGIKAAGNAVIGLGKFLSNDFVQEVIGEGSEEWMSEFLGPYADRFTINENAELSTPEDRAKAFLGGALMGVALEGSQRFVQRVAKTGKTLAYNAAAKAVEVKDSFGKTEKSIPISDEAIKATHGEAAETEATPQEAAAQSVAQEEAKQQKLSEEELMAREAAAVLKTIQLNPEVTAEELVARYPLVGEELIAKIRQKYTEETAPKAEDVQQTAAASPRVEAVKSDVDAGKSISEILDKFDSITEAISSIQTAVSELTAESRRRAAVVPAVNTTVNTTSAAQVSTPVAATVAPAANPSVSAQTVSANAAPAVETNRTSANMESSAAQRSDRDRLHAAVILANAMIVEGNRAIQFENANINAEALGLSNAEIKGSVYDTAVTPLVYTNSLTWEDFTAWYNEALVATKQRATSEATKNPVGRDKTAWGAFMDRITGLYGKGAASQFAEALRKGEVEAIYGAEAQELTSLYMKANADVADTKELRIKSADGSAQIWTVDKFAEKKLRDAGDSRTWGELGMKERLSFISAFNELRASTSQELRGSIKALNKQLASYGLRVANRRESNKAIEERESIIAQQLKDLGEKDYESKAKTIALSAAAFTLDSQPGVIFLNEARAVNKDTLAQIIPHEIVEKAKARNQSLDLSKAVAQMADAMGFDYNIFRQIVERLYSNLKGNDSAINDEVNARFIGYCLTSMDFMAELAKADASAAEGFKSYLEASLTEYGSDDTIARLQRQLIADISAVLNNVDLPKPVNAVPRSVADRIVDSEVKVSEAVYNTANELESEVKPEAKAESPVEEVFTPKAETPKISRYAKSAMTRFRNKSLPTAIEANEMTAEQILDWAERVGADLEAKYSLDPGSISKTLRSDAYKALEENGVFERELESEEADVVTEEEVAEQNAPVDEYQETVENATEPSEDPVSETQEEADAAFKLADDSEVVDMGTELREDVSEDRNYESVPYYLWSDTSKLNTGNPEMDAFSVRFDFASDRVHIVKNAGIKKLSDAQKAILRKFGFTPVKISVIDTVSADETLDGTEDIIKAKKRGEPEREHAVKSKYVYTGDWTLPAGKKSIDFWNKNVGSSLVELEKTARRQDKNYNRGFSRMGKKAGIAARVQSWLSGTAFDEEIDRMPFPGIPEAELSLDSSFRTAHGLKQALVVRPKNGTLPRFYVDVLRGLKFSRPMLDGTMYLDFNSDIAKSIWNTSTAIAQNAAKSGNTELFNALPPDFISSATKQLHRTYPVSGEGGHLYAYFSSYDINSGDKTLSTSGTIHIGTNSEMVGADGKPVKGRFAFTPGEKAYISGRVNAVNPGRGGVNNLNAGLGFEYDPLTNTYVAPFNIPLWNQLVSEEQSGVIMPTNLANAESENLAMRKLDAADEEYAAAENAKHRFDDLKWDYANGTTADGKKLPRRSRVAIFVPKYESAENRILRDLDTEAKGSSGSKQSGAVNKDGLAIMLSWPVGKNEVRYAYTAYSPELYSQLRGAQSKKSSGEASQRSRVASEQYIPKGKVAHTKPKKLSASDGIVQLVPELDGAMTFYSKESGETTGYISIVPKDVYTAKRKSDLDGYVLKQSNNLSKSQTFASWYPNAVWRVVARNKNNNQYGLEIRIPDTTENRERFKVADPSRGESLFADNADAALVEISRQRDPETALGRGKVKEYKLTSKKYKPMSQIINERNIMLGTGYQSTAQKNYELEEARQAEADRAARQAAPKRYLPGIDENSTPEEVRAAMDRYEAARRADAFSPMSAAVEAVEASSSNDEARKNLFNDTEGNTLTPDQAKFFAEDSAGKDPSGKLIRFKYQSETGKPTQVPTNFGNGYVVFTGEALVDSNISDVYILGNKRLDRAHIATPSDVELLLTEARAIAKENNVNAEALAKNLQAGSRRLYDKILSAAGAVGYNNKTETARRLMLALGYDVIELGVNSASKNGKAYMVLGEDQMIDAVDKSPNGTSALAVFDENEFDQFYENIKNMAANIPDADFITNTSGNQKYAAQGEEFGTFRKTDNPDSPTTDIPKKASKGTKNSKFLRNALTDENLSPEMRDALVRNAAEGNYAYIPLPNDEVARKASIGFERAYAHKSADGEVRIDIDKACNAFEAKSKGRKMLDAEEIYQGILLYQTLADKASATFDGVFDEEQYARNLAAAEKIVAELVTQGNMHGRAVQIMSVLKKTTRFGRKYLATRSVEKVIDDLAATKKGVPASLKGFLESEEWKDINAKFDKATTEAEYEAVEEELIKLVADRIPPTLSSRASAYRYLCMLGNPKTHIRNVASNAAMYVARSIADVGTGIAEDVFLGKNATAERYQTAKKPTQQMKDFAARMWEIEKESVTHGGTKLDFDAKLKDAKRSFGDNAVGNVFEKMSKLNSTALGAEDGTFEGLHYRKALAGWLAANADKGWTVEAFENASKRGDRAMLDILDKGKTYAADTALKMTYNNANVLANKLTELEKMDGIGGDIAKILLEGIVPFKRTPMNVLVQGIKYSPLGVVYGVAEAAGMYNSSKAKAISDISQGLTGTMALGLGIWAGLLGKAKASGLDSDKEEYYDQMIGNQDFSVTVGDTNYTLDWLTPVSMPFFAGVAASDMLREKASSGELDEVDDARLGEAIVNALSKMADPVTNLSMLQGLNTALDSYSDNKLGALATNAVQSYALQFVPTVGGQLIRTMEGERKSTYAPKDSDNIFGQKGEQFVNKLRNKSLIAHTVLGENEDYIDMWGRTEDHSGNILANAAEQFLSPGYIKKANKTEVDDKLAEVFAESKDNSVLPSTPQSYLTIDKEKFYLSSEEYRDLKQTVGSISYESVDSAFKSDLFDSLTADGKAKVISNIYTYARAKAKDDYAKANGIEYDADADLDKIAAAEATGLSAGEYYIIKYKLSKCEGKKDAKGKTISSAAEAKKMYARSIGLSREQREIFGL